MEVDFEPELEAALHAARTVHGNGYSASAEPVCTLCIVIDLAKPHARDGLIEAAAGTMSVRSLHRALRESGVRLDRMIIQQHRNESHTP